MAESGGLENRCGRMSTVGSNPTPSARHRRPGPGSPGGGVFTWLTPGQLEHMDRTEGPQTYARRPVQPWNSAGSRGGWPSATY